jgi:hypothetical protein
MRNVGFTKETCIFSKGFCGAKKFANTAPKTGTGSVGVVVGFAVAVGVGVGVAAGFNAKHAAHSGFGSHGSSLSVPASISCISE